MSNVVEFRARHIKPVKKTGTFFRFVALALLGGFGAVVAGYHLMGESPMTAEFVAAVVQPLPVYVHCSGSIRINCVVDGDTLWSSGVKIRVADIDTPEVSRPRCFSEKALGDRATVRMIELVNAGPFRMQAWSGRDEDKYGRKLRILVRDGRSLGDTLVAEGLARTWTGRREPWC